MRNNSQSNHLIMVLIVVVDFIILNVLLYYFMEFHPWFTRWTPVRVRTLVLLSNLGLLIGEYIKSPIIHLRIISAGDVLKRVCQLVFLQSFFAYFFMKTLSLKFIGGKFLVLFSIAFFISILFSRLLERLFIKKYRRVGGNLRHVTFVGADTELLNIYHKLKADLATGYRIDGYYADGDMPDDISADDRHPAAKMEKLGTLQSFLDNLDHPKSLVVCDELYVCLSRQDRETVRRISQFCDRNVIRFYFVPMSVETLGIDLKREFLDDIEIFTTHDNPLANPLNKFIKRTFDIVMSILFLIPTALILPIIWIVMKIQSPGPLLFKQLRTGLDGKDFEMLKFRSMHVNADADKVQATKDDPRKYPFGNFMRKSNIDELPQFWNVLKGDMSIVGPRPHMLAHTEQYSALIDKYMVRHFVKPGVTGWAQVTGFRGETKELWQMEGRVKRDIWYMEHWSIWLDIRIIWLTVKTFFIHDKNAY